jgi:fermentation-respiration switch protein FrsA (DUF1100 family)
MRATLLYGERDIRFEDRADPAIVERSHAVIRTIAHDPSYEGESGGQPHGTASSDPLVDVFSAAVDFLGTLRLVGRERVGVIGVCGSGGLGLAAAEIAPRIQAAATSGTGASASIYVASGAA